MIRSLRLPIAALLLIGCSSDERPGAKDGGTAKPAQPGTPVTGELPAEAQAELTRLEQAVTAVKDLSADELVARHAVPFAPTLGYDPTAARNLPLIQSSALKLTDPELAAFARDGFVITDGKRYPGFVYGYEAIYGQDLPVFISADSILHALHRSYDDILKTVEEVSLIRELRGLVAAMRERLSAGAAASLGAEAEADADLYLAVAGSLLEETAVLAPVRGGRAAEIGTLVKLAREAGQPKALQLFGVNMRIDFSQFKPRGHYQDSAELGRYFRAMMWLGRTELPILFLDEATGKLTFSRRSLAGALTLHAVMDAGAKARWTRIDDAVGAFIGEPDSMSPANVEALLKDLGAADAAAVAGIPDERIVGAVIAGRYGAQRIASQIVITPPHAGTLPLSASFLLMGQRYVVDSHVFSNVVYDRANAAGAPKRMMPDPLDVAFAALGNDQAAGLLAPELTKYRYAPDLAAMRILADEHGASYWDANLYNIWLSALRALSPKRAELTEAGRSGLPSIAATDAWGRRMLNTQLASWSELRRDTILYVKQSYTSGVACEFPDAYVDPYPAFFARIGAFARGGAAVIETLDLSANPALATQLRAYFTTLGTIAGTLGEMAEHQRTGMPHTKAHLDFVNRAVKIQRVCGGASAEGWYTDLFFMRHESTEFDPTIADVHTQPTDVGGAPVGRVLHVATGWPRLMAMTVDTCQGPRAYVGVVSAYHEKVTEKFQRLDDKEWAAELEKGPAPEVPWMRSLVVPR